MMLERVCSNNLVFTLKETSKNQNQIFSLMQKFADQLSDLSSHTRDQEKKLSNFLSTQLNSQTNILELTNKLSKEGLLISLDIDQKAIKSC